MKPHVELGYDGEVLVTWFHVFCSRFLRFSVIVSLYLTALVVGFWSAGYLMQPIAPRLLSYVVGGLATLVSGVVALLVALFVPDKMAFLQGVFQLLAFDDFRMSITLSVVFVPISRIITRLTDRLLTSYTARTVVFTMLCIASAVMCVMLHAYLESNDYWPRYVFSFVVIGLLYSLLHREHHARYRFQTRYPTK